MGRITKKKTKVKTAKKKVVKKVVKSKKRPVGRPPKKRSVGRPKKKRSVGRPKKKRAVGRPKKTVKKIAKKKFVKKKVKKPAKKKTVSKKKLLASLKEDILDSSVTPDKSARVALEQIMFRLPMVEDPLIGTPKQVQKELDSITKKMQKNHEDDPENEEIFKKIHLYMHGYLINVVLKKFPYIKGYQTVDIYQETLIALRFKAIPGFKKNKGMSFLNFAKLCIRRHLITKLNTAIHRVRDQAINQAFSLDSSPVDSDNDSKFTYANTIPDDIDPSDKEIEGKESYAMTRDALMSELSPFERVALEEYLSGCQYKEIAKNVSKILNKRYNTKSIDNALLRIRKKAERLMKIGRLEDIPLFMK